MTTGTGGRVIRAPARKAVRFVYSRILKTPRSCTLFMTNRCNLKCRGCRRTVVGVDSSADMPLSTVLAVMKKYPKIRNFCLAGYGEPTLCPDFSAIASALVAAKKKVMLITNGTNADALMGLDRKVEISISLNGFDRESYRKATCLDWFDRVMASFMRLRDDGRRVGFSYILHRDNVDDVSKVLELCAKECPAFLHFHNLLIYGSTSPEDTRKVLTTDDLDIMERIAKACSNQPFEILLPRYLDIRQAEFKCRSYESVINVDASGNIGGCQRQIPPSAEYGNVLSDADPYNSEAMSCRRKAMRSNRMPHDECRWCFGRMG